MSTETIEFQAEARQLLQLVIHSIYSTKDVFLRELVSNASDALDRLRLAAYLDKDLEVDTSDLHIALETAPEARTLTVRDNGIGMSRDEVVSLIGTIAKSGTADMLARLQQAREDGSASDQATAGSRDSSTSSARPTRLSSGTKSTPPSAMAMRLSTELSRLSPIMK